MGDDDGDRCKSSASKRGEASELVACILREVDTANVHIVELREALSSEDRQHIAALKVRLDVAWKKAELAIGKLERLSGLRETEARAALSQSQQSARSISADLWKLVTSSGSKTDIIANK